MNHTLLVIVAVIVLTSVGMAEPWDADAARADSFYANDAYDSAGTYAGLVLDLIEHQGCLQDTAAAHMMMILAAVARERSDSSEAERLYLSAAAIREAVLGPVSPELANSWNKLGVLYYLQHRDAEAESLYIKALNIREKVYGPEHDDVAQSQRNIAWLYERQGRFPEAEPLLRRAVEIREKVLGSQDLETARTLLDLAIVLYDQGRFAEAEALDQRVLAIQEKVLGPDDSEVAATLNNLAIVCRRQDRYAAAEPLYQRALRINETLLGPEHPDVAMSLENLANLYNDQGRYGEAESLYIRALAIREKTLGRDHVGVASSLNNLAVSYEQRGLYSKAEPLFVRALTISQTAYGPDHPEVAINLDNLAGLYEEEARYSEAEPLFSRTLGIREKTLGPEHPDVAVTMNNLAGLYDDEGRYADAESLYRKALDIGSKALGPESRLVAEILKSLSSLYMNQGLHADAEGLQRRALNIEEKALGVHHLSTAVTCDRLGEILQLEGRFDEAVMLGKRAVETTRLAVGETHPEMAYRHLHLGWAYLRQHRLAQADSEFTLAEKLFIQFCGSNHPVLTDVYRGRSFFASASGDHAKAVHAATVAYDVSRSSLRDGAQTLSERNALAYAGKVSRETGRYLTALMDTPIRSRENESTIAQVVFSSKGQITDQIARRYRMAEQEGDDREASLRDSLREIRFQLAKLRVAGPDSAHPETYARKMEAEVSQKERLEADLSRWSATFRHEQALWDVDAAAIAAAMPANSVLVEYMRYNRQPDCETTISSYVAVVLRASGEMAVYPLGPAAAIDTAVAEYSRHFRNPTVLDERDYPRIAANLGQLIWSPFAQTLDGSDLVWVAPDGALNLLSFPGLLAEDGRYLIEHYGLHMLSSGRDLLRFEKTERAGIGLLALGDPDFDLGPTDAATGTAATDRNADVTGGSYRNIRRIGQELHGLNVKRLAATRQEVEHAVDVWRSQRGEPCTVFLGAEASEAHFKQQCKGKRVLYLATHAFYIDDENASATDPESGRHTPIESPFLQCGVLLAGANLVGKRAAVEGAEDGILTAEEVAGLDLSGVDLVVLSACETGLGEVRSGEGVYGLRRSFEMAGARTVISTLWIVDDQASARLMSSLIEHSDLDIAHAMRRAYLDQLSYLRADHRSDHPLHWAGFVATGDWRAP